MSEEVEFEGEPVHFGRSTCLVVPPLTLGAVKKYAGRIAEFHKLSLDEQMELTGAVALAALKRNYPDMTAERVDDLVDLRNMADVFRAVVQASGFTAQPVGNAAGEASHSTGQPSTPSSPQP